MTGWWTTRATPEPVRGGVAAVTIGLFTTDEGPWGSDDAGVMVVVGGAAVGLTGALVEASGHDRLSRAIWEYNRALRP